MFKRVVSMILSVAMACPMITPAYATDGQIGGDLENVYIVDGTVEDGTVEYGTVEYGTVEYGTVEYGTVEDGTVEDGTVEYGTVEYGTVEYGTVEYGTVEYGTVEYGTVEDGTVEDGAAEDECICECGCGELDEAGDIIECTCEECSCLCDMCQKSDSDDTTDDSGDEDLSDCQGECGCGYDAELDITIPCTCEDCECEFSGLDFESAGCDCGCGELDEDGNEILCQCDECSLDTEVGLEDENSVVDESDCCSDDENCSCGCGYDELLDYTFDCFCDICECEYTLNDDNGLVHLFNLSDCPGCGSVHEDIVGWTEWTSTTAMPTESGNYYFSADITIDGSTTTNANSDINICLNGFSVNYGDSITYTIDSGTTLGIFDKADNSGRMGGTNSTATSGTALIINSGATVNMYGGKIDYLTANIVTVNGTLNMYGGEISNNSSTASNGSVGVKDGGEFNMYGGEIKNNKGTYGVGVYVVAGGEFTMYGGEIKENTGTSGVGVYLHSDIEFGMYGDATISGNIANVSTSSNGVGVYAGSNVNVTMSDNATITGNEVNSYNVYILGGGIFINTGGSLVMNDSASITKNKTSMTGGGAYINSASLVMNDNTSISENNLTTASGKGGGGVYVTGATGTLTMNDNATISDNIGYVGGGGIYVNAATLYMNDNSSVNNNAGGGYSGAGVYVAASGTFYMNDNSVISGNSVTNSQATYGAGVYINNSEFYMDGGEISENSIHNATNSNGYSGGGGLGVSNSSSVVEINNAKISGNKGTSTISGAGINVAAGTVTIKNSEISGNVNNSDCGGIYIRSGTVTIENTVITDNSTTANGGGIYIYGGTLTLDDTVVNNNTSTSNGGGVYVYSGTFKVNGDVNITGNKAGSGYANNVHLLTSKYVAFGDDGLSDTALIGVTTTSVPSGTTLVTMTTNAYANSEDGTRKAVANNFIDDTGLYFVVSNTAANAQVVLASDVVVVYNEVEEQFYSGSPLEPDVTVRSAYSTITLSDTWVEDNCIIEYDNNTEAGVGTIYVYNKDYTLIKTLYFDIVSDACICGSDHIPFGETTPISEWRMWDSKTALPTTAGNYYLSNDIVMGSTYTTATGSDINICLNGKHINDNSRQYTISSGSTVNIFDSTSGEGRIGGTEDALSANIALDIASGGTVNMYSGTIAYISGSSTNAPVKVTGVFNMYGGTIANNTMTGTSTYTGPVYVSGDGVFNMYDGEISGNNGNHGRGVYVNVGTFNMYDGTITGNTASYIGGGVYINSGTGNIYGGKITLNQGTNGGGLANSSSGTLNISDTEISNNVATGYGGGISALGTLTVNNSKIINNTTATTGGGIYTSGSSITFNVTDSIISDNVATTSGGGIHMASGTLTLSNSTITGNTATTTGGGIHMTNTGLKVNGLIDITGNKLSDDTVSNVHLASGKVMTVSSEGKLSDDARIGVTIVSTPSSTAPVALTSGADYGANASENNFINDNSAYFVSTRTSTGEVVLANIDSVNFNYVNDQSHTGKEIEPELTASSANTTVVDISDTWVKDNCILVYRDNVDIGIASIDIYNKNNIFMKTITFYIAGDVCGCGEDHFYNDNTGVTNWRPWDSETAMPTESGSYYLTSNVTISASQSASLGSDINFCLNGFSVITGKRTYTITGDSIFNIFDNSDNIGNIGGTSSSDSEDTIFKIEADAELNMYGGNIAHYSDSDSPIDNYGTFNFYKGNITDITNGAAYYGIVRVRSGGIFNMYDGAVIKDNGITTTGNYVYGGVVSIYTDGVFNMYGGDISNNKYFNTQYTWGGAVYVNGGTFNMLDGTISGNRAGAGGGVYVSSGIFNMKNGSITENSALNNTGASNGAGVYVSSGTFTMNGGLISENSGAAGAGIFLSGTGSSFVMNGGEISDNISSSYGAGICAYTSSTVTINGGLISKNIASLYGGGIYIYTNAVVSMTGGEISENEVKSNATANYGGGGVFVAKGTFNMSDGKISGNSALSTATTSGGGGIYVNSPTGFNITGGEISENTARIGGGIYIYAGTVNIEDCTISKNTSSVTLGGGVYMYDGVLNVTDSEISENVATTNGGGIYMLKGTVVLTDSEITNNTATTSGAGIYMANTTLNVNGLMNITGNTLKAGTTNNVYLASSKVISTTNGLDNSSRIGVTTAATPTSSAMVTLTSGGNANSETESKAIVKNIQDDKGIYFLVTTTAGEVATALASSISFADIESQVYTGNPIEPTVQAASTISTMYTDGWAENNCILKYENNIEAGLATVQICNLSGDVITTKDFYILSGTCYCGEDHFYYGDTTEISGWRVWNGPGLPTTSGNYCLDSDVALSSNTSIAEGSDINICLNGHKVSAAGYRYTVATGSELSLFDNTTNEGSIGHGTSTSGTIAVNGTFNLYGGDICDNTSITFSSGGAVTVASGAIFNMYGGKISDNGGSSGRGVYVSGGQINMYGGEIVNNTATGGGGGVYLTNYATNGAMNMYGGKISGNTGSVGGGICVNGAYTFRMVDGEISGNTAVSKGGGVYISSSSIFYMEDGVINKNITETASTNVGTSYSYGGGGVYVIGEFVMTGGEISYNESASYAGGVYIYNTAAIFDVTDGVIIGNESNYSGGAIYGSNGVLTITDSIIEGNAVATTGYNGGGAYISGTTVNIVDSKISSNEASSGGGIYLNSGTLELNNTEITDNIVETNGGGVHMYNGIFRVSGEMDITGNVKSGDDSTENNVYLASGKFITFANEGLEDGSSIGVTYYTTVSTTGTVTSGADGLGDSPLAVDDYFYSDGGLYLVSTNTSGEIILVNPAQIEFKDIPVQTYTGTEVKPTVEITSTAYAGLSFDVVYKNNIDVGTATAEVTIKGLTTTTELTFEIVKSDSEGTTDQSAVENITYGDAYVTVKYTPTMISPVTYTVAMTQEDVVLYYGDVELDRISDVKVNQEVTLTFDVTKVNFDDSSEFDGKTEREFTIEWGGDNNLVGNTTIVKYVLNTKTLTGDVDTADESATRYYNDTDVFTGVKLELTGVLIGDTVNASPNGVSASVDVGLHKFTPEDTNGLVTLGGEDAGYYNLPAVNVSGDVTIIKKSVEDNDDITVGDGSGDSSGIDTQTYTGEAITPAVVVKDGDTTLVIGVDYTIVYGENIKAGVEAGSAVVTFQGKYDGNITIKFDIEKAASEGQVTHSIVDDTIVYGDSVSVVYQPSLSGGSVTGASANSDGGTATLKFGETVIGTASNVNEGADGTISFVVNSTNFTDGTKFDGTAQTFTVSWAGDNNLNSSETTFELNLKPATLTGVIDVTKEWDGSNSFTDYKLELAGFVNGDSASEVTGKFTGTTDKADAGEYTADAVTVTDVTLDSVTNNYHKYYTIGTDNITSKKIVITSKSIDFTDPDDVEIKVDDLNSEDSDAMIYTGSAIEPDITLIDKSGDSEKTLVAGTDYDLTYSNNINVGEATITVTLKGDYSGTASVTFKIVEAESEVNSVKTYRVDGTTQAAEFTYGDTVVVKYVPEIAAVMTYSIQPKGDVVVKYNGVTVGTETNTVTENGSGEISFVLGKTDGLVYDGNTENEFTIEWGGDSNLNAGSGTFTLTLNPKALTSTSATDNSKPYDASASFTDVNLTLTGVINSDTVFAIVNGEAEDANVGTSVFTPVNTNGKVTLTGDDAEYYELLAVNVKNVMVNIDGVKLEEDEVEIDLEAGYNQTLGYIYTGGAHTPKVDVELIDGTKLAEDTDYDLSYKNNINVGETAEVIVTFKGGYSGSVTVNFKISQAESKGVLEGLATDGAYTYGETVTVQYKPSIKEGTSSNTTGTGSNAPTITLGDQTITGTVVKENGNSAISFVVNSTNFTDSSVFDGTAQTFTVSWAGDQNLESNTVNFDLKLSKKQLAATVNTTDASASREYDGTDVFNAVKLNVTGAVLSDSITSAPNGTVSSGAVGSYDFVPSATGGLVAISGTNSGYYELNSSAVSGKVEITGVPVKEEDIEVDLDDVSGDYTNDGYVYNGSAWEPEYEISDKLNNKVLEQDTDYTLSYTNNVNVGTGTVTITFIGDFTGSLTTEFEICKAESKGVLEGLATDGAYTYGETVTVQYKPSIKEGTSSNTTGTGSNAPTITLGDQTITGTVVKENGNSAISFVVNSTNFTDSSVFDGTAQTFTVSWSGDQNLESNTVNFDLKLSKKQLAATVNTTDASASREYDGTDVFNAVKLNVTGAVLSDSITSAPNGTVSSGAVGSYDFVPSATADLVAISGTNSGYYELNSSAVSGKVEITGVAIKEEYVNVTLEGANSFIYNGIEHTPTYAIVDVTTTPNGNLVKDTDYRFTYTNNIGAGTATVTIEFIKNFSGSLTRTFEIAKGDSKGEVSNLPTNNTITYGEIVKISYRPSLSNASMLSLVNMAADSNGGTATLKYGGKEIATIGNLIENGTDEFEFTVNSGNFASASDFDGSDKTFTVEWAGDNNLNGNTTTTFTLNFAKAELSATVSPSNTNGTRDWNNTTVFEDVALTMNASEFKNGDSGITGVADGNSAEKGSGEWKFTAVDDNSVELDGTNSGYYYLPATEVTGTVEIKGLDITDEANGTLSTVIIGDKFVYNGGEHNPKVDVTFDLTGGGSFTLNEKEDYDLSYNNNINASTSSDKAVVIVTFKGQYAGSEEVEFTIDKADFPIVVFPTVTEITYPATLSTSVLNDSNPKIDGGKSIGSFEWADGTVIPQATEDTSVHNSYEVVFTINSELLSNYNVPTSYTVNGGSETAFGGSYTADVEISVLNADITDTTADRGNDGQSYVYDDGKAIVYELPTGETENLQQLTIKYRWNELDSYVDFDSLAEITLVGKYTLYYEFTAPNHNVCNGQIEIEVTKKPDVVTFTDPSNTFFYKETIEFSATSLSDDDGDEIVFTYKEKGANDTSYTETKPVDVGEYIVRGTSVETHDYASGYSEHEFAVVQSGTELDVTADGVVEFGSEWTVKVTPSATAEAPVAVSFALMSEFILAVPKTEQVALFVGNTQITEPVAAYEDKESTIVYNTRNKDLPVGDHTVTVRYYGDDNLYKAQKEIDVTVTALAIDQDDVDKTFDMVYAEDQNFTFTGSAINPTGYEFYINDLIVDATDYANVVYGENIDASIDAGSEKGSITFDFTGNYSGSYTVYFDIQKVMLTPIWSNLSVEYNEDYQSPTLVEVRGYDKDKTNVVRIYADGKIDPGAYTLELKFEWNPNGVNDRYSSKNFYTNATSVAFTIGKASVTFTADTDGNVTAIPAGFTDYIVEYVNIANGEVSNNLSDIPDDEKAIYEIIVTLGERSKEIYALVGGTNGSVNLGYMYVNQRIRYCYITFGSNDAEVYALGETVIVPSTNGDGKVVSYWTYGGKIYKGGETFQCTGSDMIFTANYSVGNLSGTVTQDNLPAENAMVEIKIGSTVFNVQYTDEDGSYSMSDVAPGVYNIVTTYGENVITSVVTVTSSGSYTFDIDVPAGYTNSVVMITDDTKVVVDGIDEWYIPTLNEHRTGNTVIPVENGDKEYIVADKIIEITAAIGGSYVSDLKEKYPAISANIADIEDEIMKVYDINLTKGYKSTGTDSGTIYPIYTTNDLVAVTFDLSPDMQKQSNYFVYRIHDVNENASNANYTIDKITTSPNDDGEYIKLSSNGSQMTIYMNKFCSIGICWDVKDAGTFDGTYNGTSYPNYMAVTYGYTAPVEAELSEAVEDSEVVDNTTSTYPSSSLNPNTGLVVVDKNSLLNTNAGLVLVDKNSLLNTSDGLVIVDKKKLQGTKDEK